MKDINNDRDDLGYTPEPAEGPGAESDPQSERYLRLARTLYSDSTDYFAANIAPTWETNVAHFRNQHAPGTKYNKAGYKRSKIFRPKTRSALRSLEAAMAVSAFSTMDLVAVSAVNTAVAEAVVNADIMKYLLQHRLEKSIPWFLTLMGAFQDCNVYGICISHQYWDLQKTKEYTPAYDEDGLPIVDEDGEFLGEEHVTVEIDRPMVDLIAPENFRFSPEADWRDPVNTSRYLIHEIPLTLAEIREQIAIGNFNPLTDEQILSSKGDLYDSTRSTREGRGRADPLDEESGDLTVIPVRRFVVREDGVDMHFITAGTEYILSDAVPIREVYPHLRYSERPYVLGYTTLEAHRNYPSAAAELVAPLQEELNEITNQRLDNVKLVLNKRYHVRRGANVDLPALMRNTPGGGVMMSDPDRDVKVIDTRDVTGSSYQEQDRLSIEHDELVGNFSQGTVMNSRKLNETVGGMQMMSGGANAVQDYTIKIFIETWLEPVLRQLARLEAYYETDETILALAGADEAQLFQKFGRDVSVDEILRQDLSVSVNVGMGMTDPMKRVERLMFGINQVLQLPTSADRIKAEEVEKEIFGALGYRNGARFFETTAEFQERMAAKPPQEDPMVALKKEQIAVERERVQTTAETERYRIDKDFEARTLKMDREEGLRGRELETRAGVDMEKVRTQRQSKALDANLKTNEMVLKQQTGQGI